LREIAGKSNIRALVFDGVRAEESDSRANYSSISEGKSISFKLIVILFLNGLLPRYSYISLREKGYGITGHHRRCRVKTTVSVGLAPYSNLLKNLDIIYPDHVWCGDISYISFSDGSTAYLAILMDIYTLMIRGWSLRRDLSELLVLEILHTGHIPLIHHTDQGSHYKSDIYGSGLLDFGTRLSVSGKGKAWDNPFAEIVIGHHDRVLSFCLYLFDYMILDRILSE
jgi:transposase InsO family protein